jgi:hypothetical protein
MALTKLEANVLGERQMHVEFNDWSDLDGGRFPSLPREIVMEIGYGYSSAPWFTYDNWQQFKAVIDRLWGAVLGANEEPES